MSAPASDEGRPRVCFLYIAQAHQVLHSLSVAVELARRWPQLDVEVAGVTPAHLDYARSLLERLGGAPIRMRLLGPSWLRALRTGGRGSPLKLPMLAANVAYFAGCAAIVTPERTTAVLRRLGVRRPKLIYTQHGAGDRAGPFEPRLKAFDLVFAAGPKQRDRMVDEGLVRPQDCAIVGYPKFDLVDALGEPPPRLFEHERPIVFYNPHFDPSLSSWPRWGADVLAAFAAQDRYNLIFAPHIRLFDGAPTAQVEALRRLADHPQIHVDLGGPAAIDMTYTRMSDVYLGDVSSQVYEFIRRPRPCVFLNAHGADWREDESYRHWRFGPVLDRVDDLIAAIDAARRGHDAYKAEQVEGFRRTFDLEGGISSQRAAQAIADRLLRPEKPD